MKAFATKEGIRQVERSAAQARSVNAGCRPFGPPVSLSPEQVLSGDSPPGLELALHNGFRMKIFRGGSAEASFEVETAEGLVNLLWLAGGGIDLHCESATCLIRPTWCPGVERCRRLTLASASAALLLSLPSDQWRILETTLGEGAAEAASEMPFLLPASLANFAFDLASADWFDLSRRLELEARCLQLIDLTLKARRKASRIADLASGDVETCHAIAAFLEANLAEEHSLAELSRRFHINEFALKRDFKHVHGLTVFEYLRRARMTEAEALLRAGKLSVMEVASRVGYVNASHFARNFKDAYGLLPKGYQCLHRPR